MNDLKKQNKKQNQVQKKLIKNSKVDMTNNDENQPQWNNIDRSDSWCETDLKAQKMSKGTFIWKISGFVDHRNKFVDCPDMDNIFDSAKSREFIVRAPDGKETKWMLQCIPRYQRDFVKVLVVSRNKFEVKAMVTLCVNTEEWDLGNHGCTDSSFKFTGTQKFPSISICTKQFFNEDVFDECQLSVANYTSKENPVWVNLIFSCYYPRI